VASDLIFLTGVSGFLDCIGGVYGVGIKFTDREPCYPLSLRHFAFNDRNVSSEKAKNELDFEPTPLEEGLRTTVDWIKKMEIKR
jgi:nucleoside-diphosphate-sugar epimerase